MDEEVELSLNNKIINCEAKEFLNENKKELNSSNVNKDEEEDNQSNKVETTDTNVNHEVETGQNETSKLSAETSLNSESNSDHITYNENGIAIYTDPQTNVRYKVSETTNNWEAIDKEDNPYENEHYRWCFETNKWIPKIESNINYSFEDGCHTYKDKDGTTFFYDENKKGWFPKIDDDFLAIYQLNYGFDADGNEKRKVIDDDGFKIPVPIKEDIAEKNNHLKKVEQDKIKEEQQNKKRKTVEPPKWFDMSPDKNTKVYVSNLPPDITEQEFTELMSKCGLIMKDPSTQKFKVKLYTDKNNVLKGDGLCDYIKVESVDLALKILDGYDIRGKEIKVQRATFEMRGEYNPALKPKKKKKDKEKLAKLKEKLLDWRPDKMRGERSKHERVVIIKNLFDPQLFEEKIELILEYQNDLREECNKCGNTRKVIIYDRHPDGVASISMSCPEEADLVVQMMNRRFYGKRRLVAEIWDGKSKYKIDETKNEEQNRLSNWDKYLEEDARENAFKIEESIIKRNIDENTTNELKEQQKDLIAQSNEDNLIS